jgi:hypothetical protein
MLDRTRLAAAAAIAILCSSCASMNTPRPWPFQPPAWIHGRWEGSFDHWNYRNPFQTDGLLVIEFFADRIETATTFRDPHPPRTYHDSYDGVVWFERMMATYRERSADTEYIVSAVIARWEHILFWIFRRVDDTRIALYEYESEQARNYERALADARRDAVFICYLDKR